MKARTIEKVVTTISFDKQKSDFANRQTKSYSERFAALGEIREEYKNWKYSDA